MQIEPQNKPPSLEKKKRAFKGRRLAGTLITFWAAIIVAAWFAVHRPFSVDALGISASADIAAGVGRTLSDLLLLTAIATGAGASGFRLLEGLKIKEGATGLELALYAFGLGLGVEIFAVLGLGLLGGLNKPVMYLLLLGLILLNPRQSLQVIKGYQKLVIKIWGWFLGAKWWERALAFYLGIALAIPLTIGLAPVFSWDAIMYHLAAPKLYVQSGRIYNIFEMPPASYPFGIEMLYTWSLTLQGDELAQTIHWLFMPLGGAAIWAFAERFFTGLDEHNRQRAALLAVTLYFSVPHVQLLASWSYTDLLIAFYALLGLHALLVAIRTSDKPSWGYVSIAAVFAGLAFSGKYTAVTVAIAIIATGLYFALATGRFKLSRYVGWGFLYGGIAFAVVLPWLIRNWFFTGNPVAPIFWGVNGWQPDEIAPIVGKGLGQALSLEMVLGRPFKAAIFGAAGGAMDATISPLYLAFLPLTVWAAWREKVVAALLLNVGVQYFCWIAIIVSTAQLDHSRILLPTFPLLALATGYGLAILPSLKAGMLKTFAAFLLGIFLLGNLLNLGLWFAAADTAPYLAGLQTKDAFLSGILGSQIRAAHFVNTLPQDSYTFFLFEPRSYYFDRKVAPDLNGGEIFYFVDDQPTPEKMQAELKRRGVTHLLIWEAGLKFIQDNPDYVKPERAQAAVKLLEGLKTRYLTLLYEEKGQYSVYTLE
jgi:hypothetical protein